MRDKNYFFGGITEILILAILAERDSYVYEITKFISRASERILNISQNTTYAVTYKLEGEGKISQYPKLVGKRRTRIYYHLEPAGVEYYNQLMANFNNTVNGMKMVMDSLKDESVDY